MTDRLLRVDEASLLTGWKTATLRQKILRRELTFVKLGRSVRIPLSVIEKLIAENTIPARGKVA